MQILESNIIGFCTIQGCQPYTIEPCQHSMTPVENSCSNKTFYTPECSESKCTNTKFGKTYTNDKHRGNNNNFIRIMSLLISTCPDYNIIIIVLYLLNNFFKYFHCYYLIWYTKYEYKKHQMCYYGINL